MGCDWSMGCVLDESGTDEAECPRKVANGGRVAPAVNSIVPIHLSENFMEGEGEI